MLEFYNLQEVYKEINHEYFEGKIDLPVRWFGRRDFMPRRRIVLGSYNHQKKAVKIHRFLDRPVIPLYFLSYIVYHELLHHVFPPIERRNRRRRIHHNQFLEEEKRFRDYDLAQNFRESLKKHLFT